VNAALRGEKLASNRLRYDMDEYVNLRELKGKEDEKIKCIEELHNLFVYLFM
jgi:hypothetical protein